MNEDQTRSNAVIESLKSQIASYATAVAMLTGDNAVLKQENEALKTNIESLTSKA